MTDEKALLRLLASLGVRRSLALVCFGVALLLEGCRGKPLALGDDDPPPLPVPTDIASRCKPAPTTARTFETRQALESALVGRWFRCRGADTGALYAPGVELTADSEWYELIDDGSGALVRSTDKAQFGGWAAEAPVTVHLVYSNHAIQTLVVLFDPDGLHFSVERSTFDTTDVGYVHE